MERCDWSSDVCSSDLKSILKEGFEMEYRRIFGRTYPEIAVEVLNWRVVVSAPTAPISLANLRKQVTPTDDRPERWREVFADTKGDLARWPVYRWEDLLPGGRFWQRDLRPIRQPHRSGGKHRDRVDSVWLGPRDQAYVAKVSRRISGAGRCSDRQ